MSDSASLSSDTSKWPQAGRPHDTDSRAAGNWRALVRCQAPHPVLLSKVACNLKRENERLPVSWDTWRHGRILLETVYFTLRFDPATEQAVRALWRRIASIGIDVAGLTGHRPHITLAGYEVDHAERYRSTLAEFALGVAPFSIEFGHLGVFPDAGVVFLAPTVNRRLLAMHRALVERFAGPGLPPIKHEHLLPDRWVPHCTLVIGVDPSESASVVALCQSAWKPITGTVEGIGALAPPEVVDRYDCSFVGSEEK